MEKEIKKLENSEVEKVSGGTITHASWCDRYVCNFCYNGFKYDDGIPLSSDVHICNSCIEKKRQLLGDAAFAAWIINPNVPGGFI